MGQPLLVHFGAWPRRERSVDIRCHLDQASNVGQREKGTQPVGREAEGDVWRRRLLVAAPLRRMQHFARSLPSAPSACYERQAYQFHNTKVSTLATLRRVAIRIGRNGWQIIALGLHLGLNFLDPPVELLVFALKFFPGIVIDHDVGIDAVAFYDPIFPLLRIRRELRPEKLAAISSGSGLRIPMTPPQVRLPINLPRPSVLKR